MGGRGFAIGRHTLLNILAARASALGVELRVPPQTTGERIGGRLGRAVLADLGRPGPVTRIQALYELRGASLLGVVRVGALR